MKNRKATKTAITPQMAEEAVKRRNYWIAFEKLCERLGKKAEFFRFVRRRDQDATLGEINEFKRKMTRLLAFNYDVHRRPNPCANKKLFGTEPLNYPPEWRE